MRCRPCYTSDGFDKIQFAWFVVFWCFTLSQVVPISGRWNVTCCFHAQASSSDMASVLEKPRISFSHQLQAPELHFEKSGKDTFCAAYFSPGQPILLFLMCHADSILPIFSGQPGCIVASDTCNGR